MPEIDSIIAILNTTFMNQSIGVWLTFFTIVAAIMIFDLGFLSRNCDSTSPQMSLRYSALYIILATIFGIWLSNNMGSKHGIDYFTAYIVELSLSLDNLFVMSVILAYFSIPKKYQHKILFWGIIGVLIMRGIMIASGLAIVESFAWVLYIFAVFLIFTGIKMLMSSDDDADDIKDSALIRFFEKHLRYTKEINGDKFFVNLPIRNSAKMAIHATPLFMALICIEFMDVIFALDSVPAVFAITHEPFVVYSSNILAIIGLRSMYFAVVALLDRFKYMNYALSIVLIFIGIKVFFNDFVGDINHFVSMGITISLLIGGVLFSLYKTRNEHS